jgi:hypothetical protein
VVPAPWPVDHKLILESKVAWLSGRPLETNAPPAVACCAVACCAVLCCAVLCPQVGMGNMDHYERDLCPA